MTFSDLAQHYTQHELGDQSEAVDEVAYNNRRIQAKWSKQDALGIEPLEVEQWLKVLKRDQQLENPALDKTRRVMSLVFKHGQRYGLIPRTQEANPTRFVRCKTTSNYEALILTPLQAFDIAMKLEEPERTLTLLASATGLRISECLGLQWQDIDFEQSPIHVRRTWTCGKVGMPKSKASQAPVALHSMLAQFMQGWMKETPYSKRDFRQVQSLFAKRVCNWGGQSTGHHFPGLVRIHSREQAAQRSILHAPRLRPHPFCRFQGKRPYRISSTSNLQGMTSYLASVCVQRIGRLRDHV